MGDGCFPKILMAISFLISFLYLGPDEVSERFLDFVLIGLLVYTVLAYLSPYAYPEYFSEKKAEPAKPTTNNTSSNVSAPSSQPITTPTHYGGSKATSGYNSVFQGYLDSVESELIGMERRVLELTKNGIKNSEMFNIDQNVLSLGYYYPERYSFHDNYSRMILEVKKMNEHAIDYFKRLIILEDLNKLKRMTICVIPSSSDNKTTTGMSMLAKLVLRDYGGRDGVSCLYRKVSIAAAHSGGRRSKSLHKSTIGVRDTSQIRGQEVVLLDDVYTTGVSMEACRELLLENGALSVIGFVLGWTKRSR